MASQFLAQEAPAVSQWVDEDIDQPHDQPLEETMDSGVQVEVSRPASKSLKRRCVESISEDEEEDQDTVEDILSEIWIHVASAQKLLTFLMTCMGLAFSLKWRKEAKVCKALFCAIESKWDSKEKRVHILSMKQCFEGIAEKLLSSTSSVRLGTVPPTNFRELLTNYPTLNTTVKSSSLQNINRTTTSSTIVTIPRTAAVVQDSKPSRRIDGGRLGGFFTATSSTPAENGISSNIWAREDGRLFSVKCPAETSGKYVVQLKIYPFGDIVNLPNQHWWKKASFRCQTTLTEEDAETEKRVEDLIVELIHQVKEKPGATENEKLFLINCCHRTAEMDWSNETVLEFLEFYENEPIIWNASSKNHKNRNDIYDAWKRIEVKMGNKCTVTELKKKKDSLMASFRTCISKVKESSKSGAGTDEIYKPTWFAYEKMVSFLRDKDIPRKTRNTEDIIPEKDGNNEEDNNIAVVNRKTDEEDKQHNIENDAVVLPSTSKFVLQGLKRKRSTVTETEEIKYKMEKAFSILEDASKRVAKEKNISTIYGELVAAKLEAMDEQAREICMHRIDNVSFDMKINYMNPIRQPNIPSRSNYTPQSSHSSHSQASTTWYHPFSYLSQSPAPHYESTLSSHSVPSQISHPTVLNPDILELRTPTPHNQPEGTDTFADNEDSQPLATYFTTFK